MFRDPLTGTLYFSQFSSSGAELDSWTPGATPADPGSWSFVDSTPGTIAMWGVSVGDLWLMSSNSTTTFEHFNGTSVDTTCATCTPGGQFAQMWGSSGSNVFAVGYAGAIVRWNGSAWSPMTSGTTADFAAVWGTGANDVYAIGKGVFLHYDGAAWSPLPAAPGAPLSRTLWGTAGNDVFVSTTEGVFHFDGVRWSPVRVSDLRVDVIAGAGNATFMFDENHTAFRLVRTIDWSN
jgi:hypothetical protein